MYSGAQDSRSVSACCLADIPYCYEVEPVYDAYCNSETYSNRHTAVTHVALVNSITHSIAVVSSVYLVVSREEHDSREALYIDTLNVNLVSSCVHLSDDNAVHARQLSCELIVL
jgi:hypothetical protein